MIKRFLYYLITVVLVLNLAQAAEPIANIPNLSGNMTRQEAIWYYTLKVKYWPDTNERVRLVVFGDNSTLHTEFVREVLGLSVSQYRKMMDYNINSGNATYILTADSVSHMMHLVESTPYSIGYVPGGYMVLNGGHKSVKILRITE